MTSPYAVVRRQFSFFFPHALFPQFQDVIEVHQEEASLTVVYPLPEGGSSSSKLSTWEELENFLRPYQPTAVEGVLELEKNDKSSSDKRSALLNYLPATGKFKLIPAFDLALSPEDEKLFLASPERLEFKEVVDAFAESLAATSASQKHGAHGLAETV